MFRGQTSRLVLDALVTARCRLDDIAPGVEDMYAGCTVRGVVFDTKVDRPQAARFGAVTVRRRGFARPGGITGDSCVVARARVADRVWIALVVPPAVLVLAMLLQRLESALLTGPWPAGPGVAPLPDPHIGSRAGAALVLVATTPEDPSPSWTPPERGRMRPAPRAASKATV